MLTQSHFYVIQFKRRIFNLDSRVDHSFPSKNFEIFFFLSSSKIFFISKIFKNKNKKLKVKRRSLTRIPHRAVLDNLSNHCVRIFFLSIVSASLIQSLGCYFPFSNHSSELRSLLIDKARQEYF